MLNTLILEKSNFSVKAIATLECVGKVLFFKGFDENNCNLFYSINVLFCRLGYNLDDDFLSHFPNLKYIVSPTTGCDHIDLKYTNRKNINVITLKGELDFLSEITSTPELTWGLLICLIRKIHLAYQDVLVFKWDREKFKSIELSGKTIGILGFGRIGKKIAKYAEAFGMKVFAHDPHIQLRELDEFHFVHFVEFHELFRHSSILTIHVPLNDENTHLITLKELSTLPKGAFVVNSSRGSIINQRDLINLTLSGHIAGVACDVIDGELAKDSKEFIEMIEIARRSDRFLITPHIGGATFDAMSKSEEFLVQKLISKIN